MAIATMSDGSKRDLTGELRWLADTPTVFAFPKPGLLKAIGAGEGRFTVFGDQLRQSNAAAYGSGNVFGPAPKTAPKVPATGKLYDQGGAHHWPRTSSGSASPAISPSEARSIRVRSPPPARRRSMRC